MGHSEQFAGDDCHSDWDSILHVSGTSQVPWQGDQRRRLPFRPHRLPSFQVSYSHLHHFETPYQILKDQENDPEGGQPKT